MPYSRQAFAAKIRTTDPVYNDYTDDELIEGWLKKYPGDAQHLEATPYPTLASPAESVLTGSPLAQAPPRIRGVAEQQLDLERGILNQGPALGAPSPQVEAVARAKAEEARAQWRQRPFAASPTTPKPDPAQPSMLPQALQDLLASAKAGVGHEARQFADTVVESAKPFEQAANAIMETVGSGTANIKNIPTAIGEVAFGTTLPGHEADPKDLVGKIVANAVRTQTGKSAEVAPLGLVRAGWNEADRTRPSNEIDRLLADWRDEARPSHVLRSVPERVALNAVRSVADEVSKLGTDPMIAAMMVPGEAGSALNAVLMGSMLAQTLRGGTQAFTDPFDGQAPPADPTEASVQKWGKWVDTLAPMLAMGALGAGHAAPRLRRAEMARVSQPKQASAKAQAQTLLAEAFGAPAMPGREPLPWLNTEWRAAEAAKAEAARLAREAEAAKAARWAQEAEAAAQRRTARFMGSEGVIGVSADGTQMQAAPPQENRAVGISERQAASTNPFPFLPDRMRPVTPIEHAVNALIPERFKQAGAGQRPVFQDRGVTKVVPPQTTLTEPDVPAGARGFAHVLPNQFWPAEQQRTVSGVKPGSEPVRQEPMSGKAALPGGVKALSVAAPALAPFVQTGNEEVDRWIQSALIAAGVGGVGMALFKPGTGKKAFTTEVGMRSTGDAETLLAGRKTVVNGLLEQYGKPMPFVIMKELFQNARDAIYKDPSRRLSVKISHAGEAPPGFASWQARPFIEVTDNGPGMTKAELQSVYTKATESGKVDDPTAMGKKGIAKLPIFFGGDYVEGINTVRVNGKLQRFAYSGTPDEFHRNGMTFEELPVREGEPTGLQVRVYVKDSDTYAMPMADHFMHTLLDTSPNLSNHITVSSDLTQGYTSRIAGNSTLEHLAQRDPVRTFVPGQAAALPELGAIDLPGARITLHALPGKPTAQQGVKLHWGNNGVWQWEDKGKHWFPENRKMETAPQGIFVDVKPTLGTKDVERDPFTAGREDVKAPYRNAVETFLNNLAQEQEQKKATQLENEYWATTPLKTRGKLPAVILDAGARLDPAEVSAMVSDPAFQRMTEPILRHAEDMIGTLTQYRPAWGELFNRLGIALDDQIHGMLVPEPGTWQTSAPRGTLFINPFSYMRAGESPLRAAAHTYTTLVHELAHGIVDKERVVSDAHGHTPFSKRVDEMHRLFAPTAEARIKSLLRGYTDAKASTFDPLHAGPGDFTPGLSELFQLYEESRRRPARAESDLLRTGVSDRRADPAGGTGPAGGDLPVGRGEAADSAGGTTLGSGFGALGPIASRHPVVTGALAGAGLGLADSVQSDDPTAKTIQKVIGGGIIGGIGGAALGKGFTRSVKQRPALTPDLEQLQVAREAALNPARQPGFIGEWVRALPTEIRGRMQDMAAWGAKARDEVEGRVAPKDRTRHGARPELGTEHQKATDPIDIIHLLQGGVGGVVRASVEPLAQVFREAYDAGLRKALTSYLDIHGMRHGTATLESKAASLEAAARAEAIKPLVAEVDKLDRARITAAQAGKTAEAQTLQAQITALRQRISQTKGVSAEAQALRDKIAKGEAMPEGFDPKKIARNLADAKANLATSPKDEARVKAWADVVWTESRATAQLLHDVGYLSDDYYQAIMKGEMDYVPLFRIFEDSAKAIQDHYVTSYGLNPKEQTAVKTAWGSKRVTQDPILSMMEQRQTALRESARNEIAKSWINLVKLNPKVWGNEITQLKGGMKPNKGYGEITVFQNGKRERWSVPEGIARTMVAVDKDAVLFGHSLISRILEKARTPLQSGATARNFGFALQNPLRDISDTIHTSRAIKGGWQTPLDAMHFGGDWMQAAKEAWQDNPKVLEMYRAKAGYSTLQRNINLNDVLSEAIGYRNESGLRRGAMAPMRAMEKFSNTTEEATKLAAFERLQKRGWSDDAAALETRGRSGSPDFGVRGTWARDMNLLINFYNANIQGITRSLRLVKENPAAFALKLLPAAAIATTLLTYNRQFTDSDGESSYDRVSDSDKQKLFVIIRPWTERVNGVDRHLPLKIFSKGHVDMTWFNALTDLIDVAMQEAEVGVRSAEAPSIGSTAAKFATNFLPGNLAIKGETAGDLASNLAQSTISSLNPALRVPAELSPILVGGSAQDMGIQAPVTPRRLMDVDPLYYTGDDQRRVPGTIQQGTQAINQGLRAVGTDMRLNPLTMAHVLRATTGGTGTALASALDPWLKQPTARDENTTLGVPIAGDFLRRFTASPFDQLQNDRLNRLYALQEQGRKATRTDSFIEQNNPDELEAYRARPDVQAKMQAKQAVNAAFNALDEIRKMRRTLAANRRDFTPEDYEAAVSELSAQENEIVREALVNLGIIK